MILPGDGQDDRTGAEVTQESVTRSRRLRDRFSSEDLQAMMNLYRADTTAREVAEKFGVSLRSVKRLLYQHGVCRERRTALAEPVRLAVGASRSTKQPRA